MNILKFSVSALLATALAWVGCSSPQEPVNVMELELQAPAPRSSSYFDFGTGDAAADRAMVWRRDSSVPLPEQLTASWRS